MQRRKFLQLALAGGALSTLPLVGCGRQQPLLLSGSDDHEQHTLCGWRLGQGEYFRIPVEQRVHAPLIRPGTDDVVFVARRPGTVAYVVDVREGVIKQQLSAISGRHFYGHAVFSVDGRWLFVPENAFAEQGRGVIGIYDATANYQRVDEFDLAGVGPHQMALMPDGFTLVVALGGLQTHPDQGRKKLNLETMQSALLYLDSRSGEITDRLESPQQHLSLRHLDVANDGCVVVGAQFNMSIDGDNDYSGPMVFSHRPQQPLKAMQAKTETWLAQHHYIASVAMNRSGTRVLTTSPRGGVVNLWDVVQGRLINQFRVNDVAGAAYLSASGGFVVSNGLGQLFRVGDALELIEQAHSTRWDNHLVLHV